MGELWASPFRLLDAQIKKHSMAFRNTARAIMLNFGVKWLLFGGKRPKSTN